MRFLKIGCFQTYVCLNIEQNMTISVQLGTGLVQISVHRKRALLKFMGFAASSASYWARSVLGLRLLTEPVEQVLLDEYPPSSHLAPPVRCRHVQGGGGGRRCSSAAWQHWGCRGSHITPQGHHQALPQRRCVEST